MKKVVIFGMILSMASMIMLYSLGCGQQTGDATTTTLPSAPSIALSGSIATGTISSAGIKSFAAVSNYNVVAVDNATGQTYYGNTDSSGDFSVSVPSGVSYEVSLIDSDSQYFGPIVMVGDTSSSEVVTGIDLSSDTDLGSIVLDSSKSMAQPSTVPNSANADATAVATNGVPQGAGNDGKTEQSGITNRTGADIDQDGIPNVFDADEDNDGIRNGIASNPTSATVVSNTIETVYISSNIWADHGTTSPAEDIILMRIHVVPKSGKLNEIVSVEVVGVPASIANAAIIWNSDSIGSPESYPSEGTLWSSVNYNLYKTTTLTNNEWTVLLIPKAIMNVGDIFTVRVHYGAGNYQDFFISTAYVMTDWSKINTYNTITMPSTQGVNSDPVTYNSNSLQIVFSKPLDEDGNLLSGLTYSVTVGTCEGSAPYGVPTNSYAVPVTDVPAASTLTATISTVTPETYYIVPVSESADGQRNGEETWFTRQ
ncbi:MAG: hypothetical protein U9R38_04040 [Candidatus Margulisiibacteriota bacterium]|nr:hypothetical protein [Candidatus Margulisiibacteriota bacterium]